MRATLGRIFHQHDAADILAVHLGDPAALALFVVIVDEVGDDLRAQALERIGPAVFLRVKLGVAGDDPAEIAVARRAQTVGALRSPALPPSRVSIVCIAATRRACSPAPSLPIMAPTLSLRALLERREELAAARR